jgi:hypothetical protein
MKTDSVLSNAEIIVMIGSVALITGLISTALILYSEKKWNTSNLKQQKKTLK